MTWKERLESELTGDVFLAANSWSSCAIGERYRELTGDVLSRSYLISYRACGLGSDFTDAIRRKDRDGAREILDEISEMRMEDILR